MDKRSEDLKNKIKEVPFAHSDLLLAATYVALTVPQPFHNLYKLVSDIEKYLVEQKLLKAVK